MGRCLTGESEVPGAGEVSVDCWESEGRRTVELDALVEDRRWGDEEPWNREQEGELQGRMEHGV